MANNNNNMRARVYTKEYLEAFETVFGVKRHFANAFQDLQIIDGIRENEDAFYVKTNNTPVTTRAYNKDENVAFGTGTANSSRFGERTEIIYTDEPAKYTYELTIHEGLDITTVNMDLDEAVLDRLYLQSEAQTRIANERHGEYISEAAGNEENLESLDEDDVLELFNTVSAYNINNEILVDSTAYLRPDLYNAVIDHQKVSSGKGSAVNIDENHLLRFKGFILEETPERYFKDDDIAYFVPNGVFIPFVGIYMARTIESENFAGLALQALAKGGEFILDDNKVAVTKVKLEVAGG